MNLKSLDVLVSGLDYMNDDLSEVNVLYAKVQNLEIQKLADKIQTFFQDCGNKYSVFYQNLKTYFDRKNYYKISKNNVI